MKRVLVTGAGGFIGAGMMARCQQNGCLTEGWDRTALGDILPLDLSDTGRVAQRLREFRPEVIFHCAGSADVGRSVRQPEEDLKGNVGLTHHLLFALQQSGIPPVRFVFLSSAAVYGNAASLPIREDSPLCPLSPYALHKVMCEEMCRYFERMGLIELRIARIFSAYGAGLRKQIFWDMHRKLVQTGRLDLFGTGEESRDYIHLSDLTRALYLIAASDSGEALYNVANGKNIRIRQAAELFADCCGLSREKISFNGAVREGDPKHMCADISRLRRLGYEAGVELKTGLAEYTRWAAAEEGGGPA